MFEGEEKHLILEGGNGMCGGHYVREGVAFLTAYAKALGMSRRAFVHMLRNAPGTLMHSWRESMTPGPSCGRLAKPEKVAWRAMRDHATQEGRYEVVLRTVKHGVRQY